MFQFDRVTAGKSDLEKNFTFWQGYCIQKLPFDRVTAYKSYPLTGLLRKIITFWQGYRGIYCLKGLLRKKFPSDSVTAEKCNLLTGLLRKNVTFWQGYCIKNYPLTGLLRKII
jgi:hypothetical protein